MPFTLHGIGTWYYGRRRMHTLQGTCEFCGRQTELVSYDTTLFFVVVFLPIIPLGRQRILQQCAVCRKHRVISLAKWEQAKAQDCGDLLEQLSLNPKNRDGVLRAISLSIAYQDEPMLNKVVEAMGDTFARDARVQAALGDAYSFFAHWPEAADAYHASLTAEDSDALREQLAWVLLKLDRPDEAKPYLQHVLDDKKRDAAGSVYYLIKGYQAQGRHDEALELMDQRDQAFPDLVTLKEYQRQRKDSTRYQGTNKKLRTSMLANGRTGYNEGNWTSRLPRWLALLVPLALLTAYLVSAFWIGQARQVFLVNGTGRQYTVVVQGTRYNLNPNSAKPVRVAEGDVEVAFADAKPGLDPVHARIETTFWSRPFVGHTFVINPDRSAVVLEENTLYTTHIPRAGNLRPGNQPTIHFGDAFYSLTGIDYEFANFPSSIQVEGRADVRKTRVGLAPPLGTDIRIGLIQKLDPQEQSKFCERLLLIDPNSTLFLYLLAARLPPDDLLKFVEPRLVDLPILVEWHRIYQTLIDREHPETDMRPRYRKLLTDTDGNANALYLLARVEPNLDDAEKLLQKAADAQPPSVHAFYALGYHALCEAHFAEAIPWFEKALPLLPEKFLAQEMYHDALLANGDYDKLLQTLQQNAQALGGDSTASLQMIRVLAIQGKKELAKEQFKTFLQLIPFDQRDMYQKSLDSILCFCEGDVSGYLKSEGDTPSFEAAFLRGQFKTAADLVTSTKQDGVAYLGLLYLAASRDGDKQLADTHWSALLSDLKKGGRDQRLFADLLAGNKSPVARLPERIPIEPKIKRVLLTVLAQRQPDQATELLALAKRLDFQRDAISLCLAKFLQQK